MADLDVALRLRLHNDLKNGSREAKRDIEGIGEAAKNLAKSRGAGALGADLDKAGKGARRLGQDMTVAGAAAARAKRDVAGVGDATKALGTGAGAKTLATDLDKAGKGARRLGQDMTVASAAAARAKRDVAGVGDATKALGTGAGAKPLATDLDKAGKGARRLGQDMMVASAAAARAKRDVAGVGDATKALGTGAGAKTLATDLDKAGKGARRLGREVSVAGTAAARARREVAGIGEAAKGLAGSRGLGQLGRDIEQASVRAKRLERQLAGLRRARGMTSLAPNLDASAASSSRLARSLNLVAGRLDRARGSAAGLRRELAGVAGSAERVDRATAGLRRITGRGGRGGSIPAREGRSYGAETAAGSAVLGRFGAGALGVGGGAYVIGSQVRKAAKSSMDFERAMIEVGKATDTSGAGLEAYGEKLMKLARETGQTKESLAGMLASAGFAGRPVQELMNFTEYAAKATKAWGTNNEETAQSLAELGNIFQADQTRIEQIGDAINTMADKSASKESDLLEYIRRAGASAKASGISPEETLAFGAAMKEVGVRTDVAATGFEALLNVMKLGDEFSTKAGEGLKGLGINSTKMRKDFVAKPVETMVGLLEKLSQVADPLKKAEIMTNLFGKEYQDDMAKLLNGLPQISKYLSIMRDRGQSAGSVRLQFAEQMGRDVAKIDRATQALDVLYKRLGDPIKVQAGGIAEQINDLIDRLEKGDTILQRMAKRFGPSPEEGEKAQKEFGDTAQGAEDWFEKNMPFLSGKRWNDWLDGQIGKTGSEAERLREEEARRKREAEILDRPGEVEGQIARQRGLKKEADGATGMRGSILREQAAKSGEEIKRLEAELAKAWEAIGELRAQQKRDKGAFDLGGASGKTGESIGRNGFGFGVGGSTNMPDPPAPRNVPLPPDRPKEFKAEVKAEAQDLSGPAKQSIDTYEQAIKAGLQRTESEVTAAAARMKSALSFTATPTITPRISAPSGGGGGAAPASAPAAPAGGGTATRSASLRRGGSTFNGPIHVHGVRDVASLERGVRRQTDRIVREARNDALHDTGTDFA